MSDTTPMNIDDEDQRTDSELDDANTDDVTMDAIEVTNYVDEDGWFNAIPVSVDNVTATAVDMPTLREEAPTTSPAESPAAIADDASGLNTDEIQYPRTSRFTDVQNRSDHQIVQDFMNTLQNRLRGPDGVASIDSEAYRISTSATLDPIGSAQQIVEAQSMGMSSVDTSSGYPLFVQRPYESYPSSSTNTHANGNITSLPENTTTHPDFPLAPEFNGHPVVPHMDQLGGGSYNANRMGEPVNFDASSGLSSRHQPETVSITQHDFMHFIHGVENLSLSVRTLISQGSSPDMPGFSSNSFPANNGNMGTPDSNTPIPGPVGLLSASIGNAGIPQDNGDQEDVLRRKHKKKSTEENRFHNVMRDLLADHSLWISRRRDQSTLKETVPKVEVDDYEAGMHEGPTLDNLRVDWTEPMSSQWNTAAIYILTRHILERIKDSFYPDLRFEDWMTTKRVFGEFKAKLSASKEEYGGAGTPNAPETDIDAAVKRARHEAKKRLKKIKNRRNMRRKTLYDCRLRIIAENLGSHPAWEDALRLMHTVGDLAMSDDETDSERSTRRRKVVRRVEKPWASAPFKIMLNTLDLYYSRFYFNGYQKPGPGPRDRLTTIVSGSPRPIPRYLPRNCYHAMYLSGLREYQVSLLQCKRDIIIPILPLPSI